MGTFCCTSVACASTSLGSAFTSTVACSAIAAGQRRRQHRHPPLAMHQHGRRKHRIHQRNFKRNSIHAGHARQPRQRKVIDLRRPQQRPGKAHHVRPQQLHRNPQKRRQHQRLPAEAHPATVPPPPSARQRSHGAAQCRARTESAAETKPPATARHRSASPNTPSSTSQSKRPSPRPSPAEIPAMPAPEPETSSASSVSNSAASASRARSSAYISGASAIQHSQYKFGRGKIRTCSSPEATASSQALLWMPFTVRV